MVESPAEGVVLDPVVQDVSADGDLRAPFPYYGGKRLVADLVWDRFGNVQTYNEPFFGSGAVLLGRPHAPRVETVNDLDAMLANFWRALQIDPEGVAHYADSPVNETDLHARHRYLVGQTAFRERMLTDPDYCDVRIAGWWVWGQCLWIGSGWCQTVATTDTVRKIRHQASGRGVTRDGLQRKRFASPGNGQGTGVHRRWQGGGAGGGSGVHAPSLTRQMPRIAAEGGSISGVTATPIQESEGLYDYLGRLSARLRRVRVCCGDWRRVLTPSVTSYVGVCGVFLDPPYQHDLRERCYSEDHDISAEVRQWALEHGDDPNFRIALCGYEDEHGPSMPRSWSVVGWKAHGGYSRTERGIANRERERIWFSPHCVQVGLPFDDCRQDSPSATLTPDVRLPAPP